MSGPVFCLGSSDIYVCTLEGFTAEDARGLGKDLKQCFLHGSHAKI